MYRKHQIGRWGENVALEFLKNNHYEIIEKNFACKQGEIDIIAKDKQYIIFIEVKTRSCIFFGNPIEAINTKKKNSIYKTAEYYLYKNDLKDCFVRFDVIEVFIMKNGYRINHVKQVI